jgi:hypothetical protein
VGEVSATTKVQFDIAAARNRHRLQCAGVLALYLVLAAVYTRPLLELSGSHIAGGPGDPLLNASILWWNATTVPFSAEWWNPPHFYPSQGVSALTENLQGISVVATPIYWLTRNPSTTYNVALFLTWPLSAFAAFLLVWFLVQRADAALLAGLAYGFTPYRMAEMGHLQMVSSYWMPLVLLGMHGYVEQGRRRWLVLFGAAWLLQSLANGYLMLFGSVLIVLWLLYFCSRRETWRRAPVILAAWGMASLPLVPVLWEYRTVLQHYGLRRSLVEPLGFSVPVAAWAEVSSLVKWWSRVFPDSSDNLFPGITAATLVVVGLTISALSDRRAHRQARGARSLVFAVLLIAIVTSVAALVTLAMWGPWRTSIAGVPLRVSDPNKALVVTFACGVPLVLLSSRARNALRLRSAFVFYTVAAIVFAVLSLGPVLNVGGEALLDPLPYRFVMYVPGFDQLRVPTRFWMLGVLCLGIATGLAFIRLRLSRAATRAVACFVVAAGLALDGWITAMPMAETPKPRPIVERAHQPYPILELPLGPDWDAAATFRAVGHRRRVLNGVSGYDPPHYATLHAALNARDPQILLAIASLGSFDVVIDTGADPDSMWTHYVSAIPGVQLVATERGLAAYRVPAMPGEDPVLGDALPIRAAEAFRHDAGVIADGRVDTEWGDDPQRPGQWVTADLGEVRTVAGVTHALGEYARDFPRLLAIDVSRDGSTWEEVWRGSTAAAAFLAAVRAPREAVMQFAFAARPVRFVRLRQLANDRNMWRVAELKVHAPESRPSAQSLRP